MSVEKALASLQRRVRQVRGQRTDEWPAHVHQAYAGALRELSADLRFEHLEDVEECLKDFVERIHSAKGNGDSVGEFVLERSREVHEVTCYFTVEYLLLGEPLSIAGVRFLPSEDEGVPTNLAHGPEFPEAGGCVAAVVVLGTDYSKMSRRAATAAEHALRILRVALRENPGIHDRQLRFRLGRRYSFGEGVAGWSVRPDVSYPLHLTSAMVGSLGQSRLAKLPVTARTSIESKVSIALYWLERARLEADHLVALLFLLFALEALLGDASSGLKAGPLARRQMILSHLVSGSFRHPVVILTEYGIRSHAVHGESRPDVDERKVQAVEWSVRDTLNEYLTLVEETGFTGRQQLVAFLDEHPIRLEVEAWLEDHKFPGASALLA